MNRFLKTTAPLILAAFFSLASAADWTVTSGRVVGVIDGDTMDLLTADRTQQRIRLSGIDAPDMQVPSKKS